VKRILFVDDEPKVLAGLRRMLHGLRRQWDMEFVESGQEALRRLAEGPFDVVVTDMRMPVMDGSQLFDEVTRRHPATVRIILSGQCEREAVLKGVGQTHQFLTKPCDCQALKATLARACALGDQLADDRLKRLVTCLRSIPSRAAAHRRLLAELESPAASIQRLGEIVARDVGMAAKVIQLVNSGFFGTPQRVSDPAHAVNLLGLDTIRALALSTGALAPLAPGDAGNRFLEALNDHSLAVAVAARRIARAETGDSTLIADAYLAGLLHQVGRLVLAVGHVSDVPGTMESCPTDGSTIADNVGAYLMELWGAPEPVVEAIALRRCPGRSADTAFGPLTAVHVAAAVVEREPGQPGAAAAAVDTGYLERIGGAGRIDAWCRICRADCPEGVLA
jgi:HD-like signal output (HDOD) protein